MGFRSVFILASAISLLHATPAFADPYTEGFQRASSLEKEGRPREAADLLQNLRTDYPQDFDLALYLAWLNFQAKRYPDALSAYRTALELSPESLDAQLGEAWTLLRMGKQQQAHATFTQVLHRQPNHPSALEGLQLASTVPKDTWALFPTASITGHGYREHPNKEKALGTTLSLDSAWKNQLTFGVVGRMSFFTGNTELTTVQQAQTMPPPPPPPPETVVVTESSELDFSQYELYARSGWQQSMWGIEARAGWINDQSDLDLDAIGFGTEAHLHLFEVGDAILDTSISIYDDGNIYQAAPSYRLFLDKSGSFIQPGAMVQQGNDKLWFTGSLVAGWHTPRTQVWAGGRFGDAYRPTWLGHPSIYNANSDIIAYGAEAGALIRFTTTWSIFTAYTWHHLRDDTQEEPAESELHLLTLGLSLTL